MRALVLGNAPEVGSSLDVQKGWLSGTAKQIKAIDAQYCEIVRS
jgi:hypothetical protein